jgi:hypothetical protein
VKPSVCWSQSSDCNSCARKPHAGV